ncbi:19101_t:CDS:2, partial [Cetraspora pellucida]
MPLYEKYFKALLDGKVKAMLESPPGGRNIIKFTPRCYYYSELAIREGILMEMIVERTVAKYDMIYKSGHYYNGNALRCDTLMNILWTLDIGLNSATSFENRSMIYYALKDYNEALINVNKALEIGPESLHAFKLRGEIHRVLGNYDQGLVDLNRALGINSKDSSTLVIRGILYSNLGDYHRALADLDKAVTESISFKTTPVSSVSQSWINLFDLTEAYQEDIIALRVRSSLHKVLKNYNQALADLNRSLEIDPISDSALLDRSCLYSELKNHNQALIDLNRVLELDKYNGRAIYLRSVTHYELRNLDKALADINKLNSFNIANSAAVLSLRGIVLYGLKNYEESLANFNKVLEIEPKGPFSSIALEYRGRILLSFNNSEGLADLYKAGAIPKCLDLDTSLIYFTLGNYDQALIDLDNSLTIRPKSIWSLELRADVHIILKNYDQALDDLNKTLEINPKKVSALLKRGILYRDHNNCDKVFKNDCKLLNENKSLRISISSGNENVDQILTNTKWTLVLESCKKAINQWLSEYFSNEIRSLNEYEVSYFIDELKDYDDLFLAMDVDLKKINIIWDENISFLTENSFSTRQKINEFMIQAIYKNDLLNASEIVHLLERLQNAEDNYLSFNGVDKFKMDHIWNLIIKMFSKKTFSTDQQAFDFLVQFANGIVNFNNAENALLLARLHIVFALFKKVTSTMASNIVLNQQIYDDRHDKKRINFIWDIFCRIFSKENFLNNQQVLEFFNKFANGIANLNEAENAFFLARLKIAVILCVKRSPSTLDKSKLFLSQQICNDNSLKVDEIIYLFNYLQNDYNDDFNNLIFDNIKLNNYNRALSDFDKALEIDPKNAFACQQRSILYGKLNDYDRAADELHKILKDDPGDIDSLELLGKIQCKASLDKLLNGDFEGLNNGCSLDREEEINGDYNQELLQLNKILEINPNCSFTLEKRGEIHKKLKNYNEALKDFNKALENNHNNVFALKNRGKIHYKLHNFEQALADFNKALEVDSYNLDIILLRGCLQLRQKNFNQAQYGFEEVLTIDPENSEALDHLGLLQYSTRHDPNFAFNLKKRRENKYSKKLSHNKRWTSGNRQVDIVIKTSGGEWKWIEPNQLSNIAHLADGGLSTVYTATWHDNDYKDKEAKLVALKTINFTNNNTSKALNEMANLSKFRFVNYTHGITKHLDSYAIVMDYFPSGDLQQLSSLHKEGIIHGDLHSGNILIRDNKPFISDLGLSSISMHKNATRNEVYGCIPYMAPELFISESHSFASDMYAIGIIMWEISAGTPECWIEMMERCWANNPKLRPDAFDLYIEVIDLKGKPDVIKKLEEADEFQKEHPGSQENKSLSITKYVSSFISCITEDELFDINFAIEN